VVSTLPVQNGVNDLAFLADDNLVERGAQDLGGSLHLQFAWSCSSETGTDQHVLTPGSASLSLLSGHPRCAAAIGLGHPVAV
jgi:hypothetical protein